MQSDEGPSSHPLLPEIDSTSNEDELPIEPISQESRPLNFFDNYEIVGGVPTFVFGEDSFNSYALSDDETRMAVVTNGSNVSVYNVLDNFSLIACKDSICEEETEFVCFWKKRNDKLVILTKLQILFYSIIEQSYSSSRTSLAPTAHSHELKVDKIRQQPHIHRKDDLQIFKNRNTLWLLLKTEEDKLFLISVSKKETRSVELEQVYDQAAQYQIRAGPANSLVLSVLPIVLSTWRTLLYQDIDFSKHQIVHSVAVNGKNVTINETEEYLFIWKVDGEEETFLDVYNLESEQDVKSNEMEPLKSLCLGKHILDVQAQMLDKKLFPLDLKKKSKASDTPLVAVFFTRRKTIFFLIWDTYDSAVILETELTIENTNISDESRFTFKVSPNMKWIAVALFEEALIVLFSLISGVLVWKTDLRKEKNEESWTCTLDFDRKSTKLFVKISSSLYVFIPPCLLHYEVRLECFDVSAHSPNALLALDFGNLSQIPRHFFFNYFEVIKPSHITIRIVDIAISESSSKVYLLVADSERCSVVFTTLEKVFSSDLGRNLDALVKGTSICEDFTEIKIGQELLEIIPQGSKSVRMFLFSSSEHDEESVALFFLRNGFKAVFFSLSSRHEQVPVKFSEEPWCGLTQTKDKLKVACLSEHRLVVIDLNDRKVIADVEYQVNPLGVLHDLKHAYYFGLHQWFAQYSINYMGQDSMLGEEVPNYMRWANIFAKHFGFHEINMDGNQILLGWNDEEKKPIIFGPTTTKDNLQIVKKDAKAICPCWAFDDTFQKLAFVKVDHDSNGIVCIGFYNATNEHLRQWDKETWNPQIMKPLINLSLRDMITIDMEFDESDGSLWLKVVRKDNGGDLAVMDIFNINPYSMESFTPLIHSRSSLLEPADIDELHRWIVEFGGYVLNMTFNGKSLLQLAIENKDVDTLENLINIAKQHNVKLAINIPNPRDQNGYTNLLKLAVDQRVSSFTKLLFEKVLDHEASFVDCAMAMRECFEGLWNSNQNLAEWLLMKNVLCWEVNEIEVPLHMFRSSDYIATRLMTSDQPSMWSTSNDKDEIVEHWKAINKRHLRTSIARSVNEGTIVIAKVQAFCMHNVCKIGLNGIIRFLLMHSAPSYIFKSSLVKLTITWKWNNVLKKHSYIELVLYMCFVGTFSAFTSVLGYFGEEVRIDSLVGSILAILLFLLGLLTLRMLDLKCNQHRTFKTDGKALFSTDPFRGNKNYLNSKWNMVELVTHGVMLFLITPLFYFYLLANKGSGVLYVLLALETILVWIKVWCFAQAFEGTGAVVLLIEHVIRDGAFFLLLSAIILIGFSFALFAMFSYKSSEDGEILEKIDLSFGNPIKAMLTLFYAMIGTFEPDVFLQSGSLAPFIVITFVIYLITQMVVMLNMLIAIMTDTFDKVKSKEEEQLLLGRARFMDMCEASLNENQIHNLEKEIGKYLYILTLEDEESMDEVTPWQGRVLTIEQNVGKAIKEAQHAIELSNKQDIKALQDKIQHDIISFQDKIEYDIESLQDKIDQNTEDIKAQQTIFYQKLIGE